MYIKILIFGFQILLAFAKYSNDLNKIKSLLMVYDAKIGDRNLELIRLGNKYDGGYVIPKEVIKASDVLMRYGNGSDTSFEKDISQNFNKTSYEFICNVKNSESGISNCHLLNEYVGTSSICKKENIFSEDITSFSLQCQNLKLENKNILMKIDIEGAEYSIMDNILKYSDNIMGIVTKLYIRKLKTYEKILKFLSLFDKDFVLVHLHGNNCYSCKRKKFPIPDVIELSYINKNLINSYQISKNQKHPQPIDQPNIRNKKDCKFKIKLEKVKNELRIVKLKSGLGNQMFQYAFGKALEHKLGKKVLFDISRFENDKKKLYNYNHNLISSKYTIREYGLNIFNLNITFSKNYQRKKLKKTITEKKGLYVYDEELLNDNGPAYYRGCFQNEKYFKEIRDSIKKAFTFPEISETDKFNQGWLKRIKSVPNSVFIHVRRGDYLNKEWTLTIDYYKKAIEYIKANVENPKFFIICQNCKNYIEKEFNMDDSFEFIGETNSINNEDWKDMVLMKECKYAIIANSTFSWWAAWLGRANEEGIVVAPTPFIGKRDKIICDNWVKIKK